MYKLIKDFLPLAALIIGIAIGYKIPRLRATRDTEPAKTVKRDRNLDYDVIPMEETHGD